MPRRNPPFGGKGRKPLEYRPLPHVEEYLENLTLDERSKDYISAIKVGLTHFSLYAETEGIKHPDEVQRHHILRFQAYLAQRTREDGEPLSLAYRQQIMKYLRSWISWLLRLNYILTNPWVQIRVGSVPKKPKPLEDDEIAALFDAHRKQAFAISPFFYHRREVILVILYGWGLRLHELAAINVAHMDLRADFVVTRNKGGGTKTLPYSDEMKQVVTRWLAHRSKKAIDTVDSLLIDSHGNQLSNAMIYKIVTELGQRAGVSINPHRLRDSFGTKMLESDVPVERIMKMMGHTQRAQTLAYARVNDRTLLSSHEQVMTPLLHKLTGGS